MDDDFKIGEAIRILSSTNRSCRFKKRADGLVDVWKGDKKGKGKGKVNATVTEFVRASVSLISCRRNHIIKGANECVEARSRKTARKIKQKGTYSHFATDTPPLVLVRHVTAKLRRTGRQGDDDNSWYQTPNEQMGTL